MVAFRTDPIYVGRSGSTRALALLFTVTACYQWFPTVGLKFLVTSFECFGVCRIAAAAITVHTARKIASAKLPLVQRTHASRRARQTLGRGVSASGSRLTPPSSSSRSTLPWEQIAGSGRRRQVCEKKTLLNSILDFAVGQKSSADAWVDLADE